MLSSNLCTKTPFFSSYAALVVSWVHLGFSMGIPGGSRECFFLHGGGNDIKCLTSILSLACLFLSKEVWRSGGKACKFLISHHLSPSCFPWQMFFINLSLWRVSDFLSPIYIRNYLLTLSFSLQQMQWQLLGFLFSRDSWQAEVLTKNPSLTSHIAWDLLSLCIKSRGPK